MLCLILIMECLLCDHSHILMICIYDWIYGKRIQRMMMKMTKTVIFIFLKFQECVTVLCTSK